MNFLAAANILFIGDPNLAGAGLEVIRNYIPPERLRVVCFDKKRDHPRSARQQILDAAAGGHFDMILSFYSDLVIHRPQIECVQRSPCQRRLITNIHPASHQYPGLAYDEMALIRGDARHGPAWHFIDDETIDAGPIIDVLKAETPPGTTYTQHRLQNQRLCLELLERQMRELVDCGSFHEACRRWCETASANGLRWGAPYIDAKERLNLLATVYRKNPTHPVFDGNPVTGTVSELAARYNGELLTQTVKQALEGIL